MDKAIWIATIIIHLVIIAIMLRERLYRILPWLYVTVAMGILENVPLYYVHAYRSADEYFYLYYAYDLMNIALYFLAARECVKSSSHYIATIGFALALYLTPKIITYPIMHWDVQAAIHIHGMLRYPNFACLIVWTFALAMYAKTVSKTT